MNIPVPQSTLRFTLTLLLCAVSAVGSYGCARLWRNTRVRPSLLPTTAPSLITYDYLERYFQARRYPIASRAPEQGEIVLRMGPSYKRRSRFARRNPLLRVRVQEDHVEVTLLRFDRRPASQASAGIVRQLIRFRDEVAEQLTQMESNFGPGPPPLYPPDAPATEIPESTPSMTQTERIGEAATVASQVPQTQATTRDVQANLQSERAAPNDTTAQSNTGSEAEGTSEADTSEADTANAASATNDASNPGSATGLGNPGAPD